METKYNNGRVDNESVILYVDSQINESSCLRGIWKAVSKKGQVDQ